MACNFTPRGSDKRLNENEMKAYLLEGGLRLFVDSGDVNVKEIADYFKVADEKQKEAESQREPTPKEEMDELIGGVKGTGEIKQYLSGESIERHHTDANLSDQDYEAISLFEAAEQGRNIVSSAKEKYGDKYVTELLKYTENPVVPTEVKALIFVSLENDLNNQQKLQPEKELELSRLRKIVYDKEQAFSRSNGLALNMLRLRDGIKYGAVQQDTMEQMLTNEEKKQRQKMTKASQVKPSQVTQQEQQNAVSDTSNKTESETAKQVEQNKAARKNNPPKDTRKKSSKKDWGFVAKKKDMLNDLIKQVKDKINKLDC